MEAEICRHKRGTGEAHMQGERNRGVELMERGRAYLMERGRAYPSLT